LLLVIGESAIICIPQFGQFGRSGGLGIIDLYRHPQVVDIRKNTGGWLIFPVEIWRGIANARARIAVV
jgi:hypothetical protein